MTLVENEWYGISESPKQEEILLLRRLVFYVSLSGVFFLFHSFSRCSPSSFAVKVKSCFLLCQCVYEGIYMTRLLVDDKTFKNIRCYSRWCFPLLVCVFHSSNGVFWLSFFFFIEDYSSNARAREKEENSNVVIMVLVVVVVPLV